jgi:hypothetical protein
MSRIRLLVLAVLAVIEIGTLAALVGNLATVHDPMLARVVGPIHGAAYLTVALVALLTPATPWGVRLLGLVPVVGGVLTVWRAARIDRPAGDAAERTAAPESPTAPR